MWERLRFVVLALAVVAGGCDGCSCGGGDGPAAPPGARTEAPPGTQPEAQPEPAPEPAPTSGPRVVDGYFIDDVAPPPRNCRSHADCRAETVLDEGGCCRDPRRILPISAAYGQWMRERVARDCGEVQCPPPPPPSEPRQCETIAYCAEGQCRNRCEDAPAP